MVVRMYTARCIEYVVGGQALDGVRIIAASLLSSSPAHHALVGHVAGLLPLQGSLHVSMTKTSSSPSGVADWREESLRRR